MSKDIIIQGVYGKLTVIKEVDKFIQPSGQTQRAYLCICGCGETKIVRKSHLIHGRVRSCGCIRPPNIIKNKKLYNTWRGMVNRARNCNDVNNQISRCYVHVDIYVEWELFNNFAVWAIANGWDESKTIDRINNERGYFPDNCRFVSVKENARNKTNAVRVTFKGSQVNLIELIERTGLEKRSSQIYRAARQGKDIEKYILTNYLLKEKGLQKWW